jgi:hypothetical protein
MQEWFRMMKDGTPAYSNFDIAAYLAEVILLGCVALRVGEGRRMEWDGPNMKSPTSRKPPKFSSNATTAPAGKPFDPAKGCLCRFAHWPGDTGARPARPSCADRVFVRRVF